MKDIPNKILKHIENLNTSDAFKDLTKIMGFSDKEASQILNIKIFDDVKFLPHSVVPNAIAGSISFDDGKVLNDASSLNSMVAILNDYKPAGTIYQFTHPVPVMMQISGTLTIEDERFDQATNIQTTVEQKITDYVQELKIGDDVIYSEIINQAQSVAGVYDFTIEQFNYTEFATQPPAYDLTTEKVIDDEAGGGITKVEYFQEVKFIRKGKKEQKTEE